VTGRSFDPSELDRGDQEREVADELQRYANDAAGLPSGGFTERVMDLVEGSPPPRRGLFAWFGLPASGRLHGLARVAAMVVALLVISGGVLAAGEFARWLREDNLGGSPTPSPVESLAPPASETPAPSASDVGPSPSVTEAAGSQQPSGTPDASESDDGAETATPSPSQGEGGTASPDESDDESQEESRTPSPSPSPES